jgi:hypothetical protein
MDRAGIKQFQILRWMCANRRLKQHDSQQHRQADDHHNSCGRALKAPHDLFSRV